MTGWPVLSLAGVHARLTAPGERFEMATEVVAGRAVRVWRHQPPTNRDVLATARGYGDRIFLVHEHARISFDAFHRAVAALAHDLVARGIGKGDRVAIAMRNRPEWAVGFYAALAIGAVAVPLNGWWTGAELDRALADSGAVAVLADAERIARLGDPGARHPALRTVLVAGQASFEAAIGAAPDWAMLPDRELPDVALAPDDAATILYTSGTAGQPKGAVATHRNMLCNIMSASCAAARTALRRGEAIPTPSPDDPRPVALVAVPLFHATGCFAVLSPALHDGMTLVLMRKWDAGEALALVARERITAIIGVPTTAWQLVEHPDRAAHDLSSLVSLGYGGAAAAPELPKRIAGAFPAAITGHGWGMTETSALATTHSAEDYAARPLSCGAPLPVMDLRIVQEDGGDAPAGETGELRVSGPNVVTRYWNDAAATDATFEDGWLRTGDIARLDDEGFLYIVDRAKDIVIRGGENIPSIEVENRLFEHPAVIDAGVVALPHVTLGEVPAAVVRLKDGFHASEEELRAHVAARLAPFKVPVTIRSITTPLPRNAAGKLIKQALRAMLNVDRS